MSKCFISPQCGRSGRTGAVVGDDEPWGTTSSSVMRRYEPAEMRNCRSGPAQLKPAMQPTSLAKSGGVTGEAQKWRRHIEHYADPAMTASMAASAVTAPSSASGRGGGHSKSTGHFAKKSIPAADLVSMRPIPERAYVGLSTDSMEREKAAAIERQRHFPYRDEFLPRSKRLLYEMALNNCSRDSVQSASSVADTASCFTLASSKASRTTRSSSATCLSRLPTADSQRIEEGIAKRRHACQLRAPMQWDADAEWVSRKYQEDGPAGLTCANFMPGILAPNAIKYAERISRVNSMIPGTSDTLPRECR